MLEMQTEYQNISSMVYAAAFSISWSESWSRTVQYLFNVYSINYN